MPPLVHVASAKALTPLAHGETALVALLAVGVELVVIRSAVSLPFIGWALACVRYSIHARTALVLWGLTECFSAAVQ